MGRRIFFFDIDGTICKHNQVSPRVKSAINAIQAKGDLCFVATGRPLTFLQEQVKDIGFDGYLLFNGAYVISKDEVIFEVKMKTEEVRELITYLREHNCEYILQNAYKNQIHHEFTRLFDFFKDLVKVDVSGFIRDFNEEDVIDDILKVEIWPDNAEICPVLIERFPNFTWHRYESNNMEVCIKGISKAWGIQKVIEHFGIDQKDTYCFGDGPNDIDMFKTIENSYVMDNADEDVKPYAKHVCPSIYEDGVAVVLESLL